MKKRLMLVLVLGIFFAPPVFGATPGGATTGQNPLSATNPNALRCENNLDAPQKGSDYAVAAVAREVRGPNKSVEGR